MKVPEGYVAFVEELPGAKNLTEAVALVLEANRVLAEQSLEGAEVIRKLLTLPAA